MSHEQELEANSGEAEQAGSSETDSGLNEAAKQRIRSQELDSAEEARYRQAVRQELRGRSAWERVVAMLQFQPGIFNEIASDPRSTGQAVIVFVIAQAAAMLLALPLAALVLPIVFGFSVVFIALFSLASRIFASEVPGYTHWFRAMLFATAPTALGVIPFVGTLVGGTYGVILQIVAIRDLARITTGRAVVVWLIVASVPLILLIMFGVALVTSLISLLGLDMLFQ